MTTTPPEEPARSEPPAKKPWETPQFLSVELLEVIAGVCGGGNPLNKDSFCGAQQS